jgi:sugar/nucleoside kinase (ribokinase family)
MPIVACLGGATVDLTFAFSGRLAMGTEIHGPSRRTFGGVARNVAENLSRLGVSAALFSAVGDGDDGHALLADAQRFGIDVRGVRVVDDMETARYVAVVDDAGAVVFAAADTAIVESFTCADLERVWPLVEGGGWIFADANLRIDVLAAVLAKRAGASFRVAVDAGSVPIAVKLPAVLNGVDVMFMNVDEAAAYLGLVGVDATVAATSLVARGAACAVVTNGARGSVIAQPGVTAVNAVVADSVDATGAGDALISGTLSGLVAGLSLVDAVKRGSALAAITVEVAGSVHPDLSVALLEARLAVSA